MKYSRFEEKIFFFIFFLIQLESQQKVKSEFSVSLQTKKTEKENKNGKMDESKNDLGPSGSQKRLQGDPTSRKRF